MLCVKQSVLDIVSATLVVQPDLFSSESLQQCVHGHTSISNTIQCLSPGRRDFLAGTVVTGALNLLAACLRRRNRSSVSCGGPPPGESLFRCFLQCTDSTWTQTCHFAKAQTAHGHRHGSDPHTAKAQTAHGYRHWRKQHLVKALIACGFRHGHVWHMATDMWPRQSNKLMATSLLVLNIQTGDQTILHMRSCRLRQT